MTTVETVQGDNQSSSTVVTTEYIRSLLNDAGQHLFRDAEKTVTLSKKALKLAQQIDTTVQIGLAHWYIGLGLQMLVNYPQAIVHMSEAEAIFAETDQHVRVVGLMINRMSLLRNLGHYSKALAIEPEARLLCETIGPDADINLASLWANVGLIHLDTGNLNEALLALERAGDIRERLGDPAQIAMNDINIANVLFDLDRFNEAETRILSAQKIFKSKELWQEAARADFNLGNIYTKTARYKQALQALEQAHRQFHSLGHIGECANVDSIRATVYARLNLWQESLTLAHAADDLLRGSKSRKDRADARLRQAIAYKKLGLLNKANLKFSSARRLYRDLGAARTLLSLDLQRARLALEMGQVKTARRIANRLAKALRADEDYTPSLLVEVNQLLIACHLKDGAARGVSAELIKQNFSTGHPQAQGLGVGKIVR